MASVGRDEEPNIGKLALERLQLSNVVRHWDIEDSLNLVLVNFNPEILDDES